MVYERTVASYRHIKNLEQHFFLPFAFNLNVSKIAPLSIFIALSSIICDLGSFSFMFLFS